MTRGVFRSLFAKNGDGVGYVEPLEHPEGQTAAPACDCGGVCIGVQNEGVSMPEGARIKVLGPGCRKCHELYANTLEAVKASGKSVEVEYVTDLEQIVVAGIMATPALVVGGSVVSSGKVLSVSEIGRLI